MNDGSRVALLDSGDEATAVLLPRAEVRTRLDGLRLRPAAGSLNLAVERALRRLESADADEGTPRLLYVFTDRTRAAWDAAGPRPRARRGGRPGHRRRRRVAARPGGRARRGLPAGRRAGRAVRGPRERPGHADGPR